MKLSTSRKRKEFVERFFEYLGAFRVSLHDLSAIVDCTFAAMVAK
ncbi:hypothetical protein QR721_08200 [Aciduricibacillus chroicocephali]|uniref:Uncharacterized protein n=1 Tax=Aciduricibacillus chroicocephali TaxID=3054939 RepID=A0ABY9KSW9_9BACI|nr:hypothetical protein QR721_08200 [Bacillaceae bacterium 44XB]